MTWFAIISALTLALLFSYAAIFRPAAPGSDVVVLATILMAIGGNVLSTPTELDPLHASIVAGPKGFEGGFEALANAFTKISNPGYVKP